MYSELYTEYTGDLRASHIEGMFVQFGGLDMEVVFVLVRS